MHQAVMLREAVEHLALVPGDIVIDATLGAGGHAGEILKKILPGGRLLGIDRDDTALTRAAEALKDFKDHCSLCDANFRDLDVVMSGAGVAKASAILFDLGVSSYQLEDPARGFGFRVNSPLDMRMDRRIGARASSVVNSFGERDLADIIFTLGEEPFARRIATSIVRARAAHPIETTKELSQVVVESVPPPVRHRKIHAATKTFQALRIYVNDELGALKEALDKAIARLDAGARIAVISFHSLEDRIVKQTFKQYAAAEGLVIVTKKPLLPSAAELAANPRSRSAKLRVAEKAMPV